MSTSPSRLEPDVREGSCERGSSCRDTASHMQTHSRRLRKAYTRLSSLVFKCRQSVRFHSVKQANPELGSQNAFVVG